MQKEKEKTRDAYNSDDDLFDIDVPPIQALTNTGLDDMIGLQDLKARRIFLNGDVNEWSAAEIIMHVIRYNRADKNKAYRDRKPIVLYVLSNGGSVDAGFAIIDTVRASGTPVYTVNLGYMYSMGALIGMSGHKRYAMPNAKYLIHDGQNFVFNSGGKAKDQMQFNARQDERIKDLILRISDISAEEYDKNELHEWYMFADEAKTKGLVDYIIGEDCELEDIL